MRQCKNCPWIVGSDPYKISTYDRQKHIELSSTIAPLDVVQQLKNYSETNGFKQMACHCSGEKEFVCVGWLNHQITVGNNIFARIKYADTKITLIGEQHTNFIHTIPDHEKHHTKSP